MRVLVTGAEGFLGRGLVSRLPEALPGIERLVLTDINMSRPSPVSLQGAERKSGDLGDEGFLDELLETEFDLVFHLASLPGGLAEREQDLGFHANLAAPLALARGVARIKPGARFIFASSIAVYGALSSSPVTSGTATRPMLSYGAHKLMTEIFLADMHRQGTLQAASLRFPGIVARPPTESGHGSAFMSLIFHRIAAGEPYTCPVPADSQCWWMSRQAAVQSLLHVATMQEAPAAPVQLPVLHADVGSVTRAIEQVSARQARIDWGADTTLQALFGAMPPLDAQIAVKLGFRADPDLDALAQAALKGD
ncbi:NAD-dependent epimerase/dehydratase family protein [Allorhizobium undicola]|uniref:NAD-dependent epimerase/dehydratase family protein n=1 Tax=Allorhizobium undicola TaxID=78527 RepID=UPI003D3540CA